MERGEGPFCVRAVRLPGLAGTLGWPCQAQRSFDHEVAGRIRVVATLDQPPVLLHDESWPEYEGARQELRQIRELLACGPDDALAVVWGAKADTVTAAEEIRQRYADAVDGVPHETRQALADGGTDFERILPGPDRMYPDTDSPPQEVTRERVQRLQSGLPELPWRREERYLAAGVSLQTARYLIRYGGARLVDRMVEECGANLRRAALFFGEELKGLRRSGVAVDGITAEWWCELFAQIEKQPVLWEIRRHLVERFSQQPESPVEELISAARLGNEPGGWREGLGPKIEEALATGLEGAALERHAMGRAMHRLRGRVPAAEVAREVSHLLAAPSEIDAAGTPDSP
jgi:glutamyl-tRNA(Gln) amidotransferase subunit E